MVVRRYNMSCDLMFLGLKYTCMAPINNAKSPLSFAPVLFADNLPIIKVINIYLLDVNFFFIDCVSSSECES